jgi:hypothetical protein
MIKLLAVSPIASSRLVSRLSVSSVLASKLSDGSEVRRTRLSPYRKPIRPMDRKPLILRSIGPEQIG